MNKRSIIAGLLVGGAVSVYGAGIQGWDVGNGSGAAVPSTWTTWDNTSAEVGGSSTVGGLTLTHTSGAFSGWGKSSGLSVFDSAPELLAGAEGVFRDGASIGTTPAVLTLSGLTAGRTYEIQFTTTIQSGRNLKIIQDGTTTKNVLSTTLTTDTWVYSPVFTFTATAGDLDTAFSITKVGGGSGCQITGVIVNAIPEPETVGMLDLAGMVVLLD